MFGGILKLTHAMCIRKFLYNQHQYFRKLLFITFGHLERLVQVKKADQSKAHKPGRKYDK